MRLSTLFTKMKTIGNSHLGHNSKTGKLFVIAHRGASGHAPENTMASFQKALDMGADYIELDVQMTRDGKLVVIHDPTVDRTTNGTGEVGSFFLNDLQQLDAGEWFSRKYRGQKIPTLEEVLSYFGEKIAFLIEIKNPNLYPTIVDELANVLGDRKHLNLIIQSFDFELLQKFSQLCPHFPLGLLVKYRVHGISNVQLRDWATVVTYINPNKALITKKLVKRIHHHRMYVFPYTVRNKKSIKGLIEANVDGIITDFPDFFKNDKEKR
ncbi:glycerophosphodiester phosphodiesterase [Metabacillus malikii]|uniref:Glycerophosphoryl diester phosphodiesterase n=1 Tax=Metabacillus malikii TaxID=1504265 RepID=A0ABT9Z9M7_9BACI|nr:glycerophosphodiester phosphodiesterase family protein [Metabacillus malikii]MDQ0228947.1 glycerophosphoryl diester phosphodiesterase [Metabacillus malikii]